jgi:hypothetical protein
MASFKKKHIVASVIIAAALIILICAFIQGETQKKLPTEKITIEK